MPSIVESYLKALEDADLDALLALFNEDAVVETPLEGSRKPSDFYANLLKDTKRSRIRPYDVMIGEKWTSVYFRYRWTMADAKQVVFECVDLLELDRDKGKISRLKVIYDTHGIRDKYEKVDDQKSGSD
jgi:ketosteroid isomerase-like protein